MIDPSHPKTYEFWDGVISDLNDYFHDDYFHFGFDELSTSCWSSEQATKFMADKGLKDLTELREYYRTEIRNKLKNKSGVYWV